MNLFRLCVANLVALFWVVIPTAMGANIIPQPSYIQEKQGTFDLAHNNNILYVGKQPEVNQIIDNFMEQMLGDYGLSLQTNKSKKAGILLQDKKSLGEEAYELSVAANKVVIKASTPAGFFYALRTVNQYHFMLVDINRMSFGKISIDMGCANFARLWGQKAFFELLAREYARARNTDEQYCVDKVLAHRKKFWIYFAKKHQVKYKLEL